MNFNNIVTYLQRGIFAEKYKSPAKKLNFQRRYKNFMYDQQTGYLFFEQSSKDNSLSIKKRVVLTYDLKLRETLFEKFHIVDAHFELLEYLQVDLVDLFLYVEHNDGYSYVLTLIDIFRAHIWCTKHSQSQEKIEKFKQILGRHLTKMMWNEIFKVQGYHWINILPQFIISYNKAPHEAHKKSPYEAFFGFKMHIVYNIILEDITEDVTKNITEDVMENVIENVTEDIAKNIIPEKIPLANTTAIQDNYNQAVICRSVHRRKVAFEPGDKVAIAPNFDNNQKIRKQKLGQTCSITGKVISMCSNNRTIRVKIDGEVKNFTAKNLRKLHKKSG
ncbi:SCAN domain-containing protein 3-like [Gigaspora margarita]|uniref:SCAN domain-containing protein 3-like n=1 Tax=Gigaspora margarita TaxID=4874 RepID=A0A8H4EJ83_GIGMA|nr:SCAN domain-containing protein 3-like [Gigaspora margarita]